MSKKPSTSVLTIVLQIKSLCMLWMYQVQPQAWCNTCHEQYEGFTKPTSLNRQTQNVMYKDAGS